MNEDANIDNAFSQIELHVSNLGALISIATRWDIDKIYQLRTDNVMFPVMDYNIKNLPPYFDAFKIALRKEFNKPDNRKGLEIYFKNKFFPIIDLYFKWYEKNKQKTQKFEPYNFYEWMNGYMLSTEKEINMYFGSICDTFDEDDATNPLIFDYQLIVDLHRDFVGYIFITVDINKFKSYFRLTPIKMELNEGITLPELCYFFGKIEHKQIGVSKFSDWMKNHIGGNSYGKNKQELDRIIIDVKVKNKKDFSLSVPQEKALENKEKIDKLLNPILSK